MPEDDQNMTLLNLIQFLCLTEIYNLFSHLNFIELSVFIAVP